MSDKHSLMPLYERSPFTQLTVSLLIVMCTGIILFSAFLLAGILIFNTDLQLLENPSSVSGKNGIAFLKYVLISQDIAFFIVPAIIILIKLKPLNQTGISDLKIPHLNEILLVVLLSFCIFPITSLTGQINAGMNLPDWLSGVEQWMVGASTRDLDKITSTADSPGWEQIIIIALPVLLSLIILLHFRNEGRKEFSG
jgi:uncharacterized protein